jgi:transposase
MPGVRVAAVARKHGATRWQIYDWRRRLRRGQLALPESVAPMFAPLMVEEPSAPQRTMRPPKSAPAKVEIVIDDMVIRTAVDLEHLAQVIRAVRASR